MNLFKKFLEEKLSKLGCFLVIALSMIAVSALAKWILTWLHFDKQTIDEISRRAGDSFGVGCLIFLLIFGCIGLVLVKNKRPAEVRSALAGPPPLPRETTAAANHPLPATPPVQAHRGCGAKGCLIAAGACAILLALGYGTLTYFASEYEKRPKQPGEEEFWKAENFIRSFDGREATGNDPDAEKLAQDFARQLRVTRQFMFTESNGGFGDLTKGRFLTYCSKKPDSVAFIVHVPGLSGFSEDAKLTLEEHAWTLATGLVEKAFPEVHGMALGLKGDLNYSAILTGSVNSKEPLQGVEKRHPLYSSKVLWPYFISDKGGSQSTLPH